MCRCVKGWMDGWVIYWFTVKQHVQCFEIFFTFLFIFFGSLGSSFSPWVKSLWMLLAVLSAASHSEWGWQGKSEWNQNGHIGCKPIFFPRGRYLPRAARHRRSCFLLLSRISVLPLFKERPGCIQVSLSTTGLMIQISFQSNNSFVGLPEVIRSWNSQENMNKRRKEGETLQ